MQAHNAAQRFEELFQNYLILAEKVSEPDERGIYTRARLVRAAEKEELIRTAAKIQMNPITGREVFLDYEADIADEVIVRLKPGQSQAALEAILEQIVPHSYRVHKEELLPVYVVKILQPAVNSLPDLVRQLSSRSEIEYAEGNAIILMNGNVIPNDQEFFNQWHLENIKAPQAWDITTGKKAVVVAVLDSGVDYNHPDLKNNMWKNVDEIPNNGIDDDKNFLIDDVLGFDFYDVDNDPMSSFFHGTAVAGIIGAEGNNGLGVSGTNWKVQIMPVRIVAGGENSGVVLNLANGIVYALSNGADIINISIGGPHRKVVLDQVEAANAMGVLIVAASGNSGEENKGKSTHDEFPASYNGLSNVISVAASVEDDSLATFNNTPATPFASNFSATYVDLAAPGYKIRTTGFNNTYLSFFAATSASSPQVAGVAALMKAANPSLTAKELKGIILSTVDKVPALEGKVKTSGRLNAYKAVLNASSGKIRVSKPAIFVTEQAEKLVVFELERIKGNYGKVVAKVEKVGGTATLGKDYTQEIVAAVWGAGEMGKKYLTFRLKDDQEPEETESILADVIMTEGGAVWEGNGLGQIVLNIQIADNEPKGIVRFKKGFYIVEESVGTVNVEVERIGGSSGAATVKYKLYSIVQKLGDTEGPVDDFIPPFEGTLTWKNGESGVKKFPVKVLNDSVKEGKEDTFYLKLNSVSGIGIQNGFIPFIINASDQAPLK